MTFQEFIEEWRSSKDFIYAYTSGSTGDPKIINLDKNFVADSARRTNDFFEISSRSRLHSCVSPDFIGGKMMAVRAEIVGAKLSWEKPSNKPLRDLNPEQSYDLVAVVPSQMIYILDNLINLPKIKNIIIGGSAIHPDLRLKIAESGLNAYETYGMTETASHIALRKISTKAVPFKVLPGIKIASDYEGCLNIRFASGEFIQTNDLAELISAEEFFIKGRRDQIIISGGKKINPVLIEEAISPLIDSPFIITGFPDQKWGEKVVLLIEGKPKDFHVLKEKIKKNLHHWQLPKEFLYVKALPRTPNGKILRVKNPSLLSFLVPDNNPCA